jgi:hypothetical protein
MTRLWRAAAVAGAIVWSLGHVGSPDTVFEGAAGPYPVRVIVRTPGVVPGLADIVVRILGDPGVVRHVTVLPLRGGLPTAAVPPPDTARAVAGDPSLYSAQLWLMSFGAYSVQVTVSGEAGDGRVLVPVNSVATRRLAMTQPMALGLLALGAFLFVGALTIVRAAVRESVLSPGTLPDAARGHRAWIVTALAGAGLVGAVVLGRLWWTGEDAGYRRRMYRPLELTTQIRTLGRAAALRVAIADADWLGRRWSPLIPDHGKLMHLFLIAAGAGAAPALAHLHPVALDSLTFETALPPLPPGRYFLFADVVHESGLSQTLTDTVDVPAGGAGDWTPTDPDDSWYPGSAPDAPRVALRWNRPDRSPLRAGTDTELVFELPGARLEPYMGMAGHAVIALDDGSVYVHLHPLGTVAQAAQLVYELREPGDTVWGRLGQRIRERAATHPGHQPLADAVRFPYSFPRAGRYRIWVQVKSGGRILTETFEAEVT